MLLRPDQCAEDSPHGSCARGPVISCSGEDVLPLTKRGDSSVDTPLIDLKGRTVDCGAHASSSKRVGRFSGNSSSIPESDSSLLKMLMQLIFLLAPVVCRLDEGAKPPFWRLVRYCRMLALSAKGT